MGAHARERKVTKFHATRSDNGYIGMGLSGADYRHVEQFMREGFEVILTEGNGIIEVQEAGETLFFYTPGKIRRKGSPNWYELPTGVGPARIMKHRIWEELCV